ncbi:MAG: hypothetical protein FWH57_11845, partial [Oscillospiraceae bacterium]|nr:hypothetical protein [Oscillospiraceae bacterium]
SQIAKKRTQDNIQWNQKDNQPSHMNQPTKGYSSDLAKSRDYALNFEVTELRQYSAMFLNCANTLASVEQTMQRIREKIEEMD